jgi:hypothetical protein
MGMHDVRLEPPEGLPHFKACKRAVIIVAFQWADGDIGMYDPAYGLKPGVAYGLHHMSPLRQLQAHIDKQPFTAAETFGEHDLGYSHLSFSIIHMNAHLWCVAKVAVPFAEAL